MIIYESTKREFIDDVRKRIIDEKIYKTYQEKIGKTSKKEIESWRNSLKDMRDVLITDAIPHDAMVAIEYQVPNTSKRVDFLISGLDEQRGENVVIVELKQWQEAQKTNKDGIVVTHVGGGLREVTHPSYQAWTYASLIRDFNQTVQEENIQLYPTAFLHNYRPIINDPITDQHYQYHIEQAPIFMERDIEKLETFIRKFIKYGDDRNILYRIEQGKIKPSKSLADSVGSMLKGNKEFNMIDEQKTVFEELYHLALKANQKHLNDIQDKDVVIVKGGPGTGKSVIAINLLARLIEQEVNSRYVTRNSAPREVYSALLKGDFKKTQIDNLFSGSGAYVNAEVNEYTTLVIDEAHRLNEKSGFLSNLGENQMKELISAV